MFIKLTLSVFRANKQLDDIKSPTTIKGQNTNVYIWKKIKSYLKGLPRTKTQVRHVCFLSTSASSASADTSYLNQIDLEILCQFGSNPNFF